MCACIFVHLSFLLSLCLPHYAPLVWVCVCACVYNCQLWIHGVRSPSRNTWKRFSNGNDSTEERIYWRYDCVRFFLLRKAIIKTWIVFPIWNLLCLYKIGNNSFVGITAASYDISQHVMRQQPARIFGANIDMIIIASWESGKKSTNENCTQAGQEGKTMLCDCDELRVCPSADITADSWSNCSIDILNVCLCVCVIVTVNRAGILGFAVLQFNFKSYFQANFSTKTSYIWTRPSKITYLQSISRNKRYGKWLYSIYKNNK